jgi:hypothetical protein
MSEYCPYAGGYTCASSPMSAAEFASQYGEWADYASGQLLWPTSLILAQWSIESEWGEWDICDVGCPANNPGNTSCYGAYCNDCPDGAGSYGGLCAGVVDGYVGWASNNIAVDGSTYANYVADAYINGVTLPYQNTYGCVPGGGTTFEPGLQAACAALGASNWAGSDYCYCGNGLGTECCSDGNYAGQTLYSRAVNYFGSTGLASGPIPDSCFTEHCSNP